MRMTLLVYCLLLVLVGTVTAQVDTLWTRTYGGSDNDGARSIVPTVDGGFITVGYSYSGGAGDGDVFLIKTDALGNPTWTRTYGGPGLDYGYGVCQTADGGYAFTGYTTATGAGYLDLYLVRTDAAGAEIWSRSYGGMAADEGRAICETSDGHLLVTGCTASFGAGESDVYLLKVDATGDTLWSRTWGGSETEWGAAICETSDSNYAICGTTGSTSGNRDVYAIKVQPDGTTLWAQHYGRMTAADSDWGTGLVPMDDGGLVLTGYGNNHSINDANDLWLIRTSASGGLQWTRRYGEAGNYYDCGMALCRTHDDGFLLCGGTRDPLTQRNYLYLVKTNEIGIEQWNTELGGVGGDWGSSIVEIEAGRYVVAGHTDSFGAGRFDAWLLYLFDPSVAVAAAESPELVSLMSAPVPNPGRGTMAFSLTVPSRGGLQVSIIDAQGRMVRTIHQGTVGAGRHDFVWDLHGDDGTQVAAGVYFVVSDGAVSCTQKAVVIH